MSKEAIKNQLLDGLNPEQRLAVTTVYGEVQANSVAGSGKTHVFVRRVGYMIQVEGIKPNLILCTTFTNKATDELKERLSKLLPEDIMKRITLGTSHSIGRRILAREFKDLKNPLYKAFENPRTGVINSKFISDIVKDMLKKYNENEMMKEEMAKIGVNGFVRKVSGLKNTNIDYRQYAKMANSFNVEDVLVSEFYTTYETKKEEQCKIDFDDMLFMAVRLLQENPTILRKYQNFYQYVLVDEAQDNNALQYEMVRMLAHPHNNIFIVGDDDQSMYKFRGATPEQFIYLDKQYPNLQRINLQLNYRSNPEILLTANKLIAHNTERIVKELVPARKETPQKAVYYNHFRNEDYEAEHVATEVIASMESEQINYKDFAVVFRTNSQTRAIEDAFISKGIPYVIHGGTSFYERKEIKDIISYFALIHDNNNNEAFERIYNVPTRYLGAKFFDKIKDANSYWKACDTVKLEYREERAINGFKLLIHTMSDMLKEEKTFSEIIDYLMEEGKYREYIMGENEDESDEENPRLANIDALKTLMERFENLEGFLNYVQQMSGKAKQDVNGVQCMTIHKSKGLEFHSVFTIGMNEGLLPNFYAITTAFETMSELPIEEERRLAYVAVTRAKEYCYISSTSRFNGKDSSPSRFIEEMELVEGLECEEEQKEQEQQYDETPNQYLPITPIHIDDSDLPF